MCAAFPRSDYYGGSAPRPRHRQTSRLAGLRTSGARIEVPMFKERTLGAVGGRLYPWQHGPHAKSGRGGGVSMADTPSHPKRGTERWLRSRETRALAPYRGLHRRLQLRVTPHRFTLAPSVARHRSRSSFAGSSDRSAVAGHRHSLRRRSRSPSAPGPTRARMTSSGHRFLLRLHVAPAGSFCSAWTWWRSACSTR